MRTLIMRGLFLLLVFLSVPFGADAQVSDVWYVDSTIGSSGDGTKWDQAFMTIQEAVDKATSWNEIWVRKGTYNLTSTIILDVKGSKLYGGFAGGETERSQRDIKNNVTEINGQNTYQCMYVYLAAPVIDGFTFSNCKVPNLEDGAALYFDRCGDLYPTVTNCTFKNNQGGYGGGAIMNYYSSPRITNSVFWNNTVDVAGGAIYNMLSSSPFITNCTFSGNSAWNGGAVNADDSSYPIIANSIFWGNTAIYGAPQIAGHTGGVSYSDVDQAGFTGNGNIRSDPLFVSPDIGNLHLRPGSPCIDAGSDSAYFRPSTDIDGDPRPVDGNNDNVAKVDMGADEYVPGTPFGIWYVNGAVPSSGNGTSWAQAKKTIQEAVAASVKGDEIWVKAGTYSLPGTITVSKEIKLYGGFAGTETQRNQRDWKTNVTTVDGHLFSGTCFHVQHYVSFNFIIDGFTISQCGSTSQTGGAINIISDAPITASISNCTITGNRASNGGGIFASVFSSVTISNTTFSGNVSQNGGGAFAVNSNPATVTVTGSTFTSNSAPSGAAIYNSANLFVSSSTFSSNTATYASGGAGGAIENWGYSGNQLNVTISDSTFENNTAPMSGGMGGAIHNRYATVNLTGSTFTGNSAQSGGAVYNDQSSSLAIGGSTFSGNSAGSGGAVYNSATLAVVEQSLFSGNTATANGGAIFSPSSHPIRNTRFISNTANSGGGAIYNAGSPSIANCVFLNNGAPSGWGGAINNQGGTTTIVNSTFHKNHANYTGGAVFNAPGVSAVIRNSILWGDTTGPSMGYNEIFDYTPNVASTDIDQEDVGLAGYNNNIREAPLFVDVSDPDPMKWDVHLQATSPCIDKGDNAAASGITTDFEGQLRVIDGNADSVAVVDMGADEVFVPDTTAPTGSVQITSTDGNPQVTKSRSVRLNVTATDASPVMMCVSNTSGSPCSPWEPYYSPKDWTLTAGDGTKTVYVWLKDIEGNETVAPLSDTIILDTTAPTDGLLTVTEGNGEIILNWIRFSDGNGSGIASYKLVYSQTGSPANCSGTGVTFPGTDTTYTHTVASGQTYYYRVCATDGAGFSSSGVTSFPAAAEARDSDPVRILRQPGSQILPFPLIQDAYDAPALTNDVIQIRETGFVEDLVFDTPGVQVTLDGGLHPTTWDFQEDSFSDLFGSITVVHGTVTISGIYIW